MSEVAVTQIYESLENRNIEAVYTFPLPLDAVLLELLRIIGLINGNNMNYAIRDSGLNTGARQIRG